jgi:hypothetical protein
MQPACYQIAQAGLDIGCSLTNGVDEYIYGFPADTVDDPLDRHSRVRAGRVRFDQYDQNT